MGTMVNQCVICGREIPEGDWVCANCKEKTKTGSKKVDESLLITIKMPREANTELSFGCDAGPNFTITYYRDKPLTQFQRWMFKICFGIIAKNL